MNNDSPKDRNLAWTPNKWKLSPVKKNMDKIHKPKTFIDKKREAKKRGEL